MTGEDYFVYSNSELFNEKELNHIGAVAEIYEEVKILFANNLLKSNGICNLNIELSPVTQLETKITHADINYVEYIQDGIPLSEINDYKLIEELNNLSSVLHEGFKKIDYDFITSSFDFDFLHIKENLTLQAGDNLESSMCNKLFNDDLRKKMQVALLSHSLLEDTSKNKKSHKL